MTGTSAERQFELESDISRPGTEFVKPGDANYDAIMRAIKIQEEVDRRAPSGGDYEALKAQVTAEFDALEEALGGSSPEPTDKSVGLYDGTKHSIEEARAAVSAALDATGRDETAGLYGPGTKHGIEELKKGIQR